MISASPATETLAAVLTADAPGAIAVIGLSGPQVPQILARVLRGRTTGEAANLLLRRPAYCRLIIGDQTIDDVVATLIQVEPFAYAEICTHGGSAVVGEAIGSLAAAGARVAPPDQLPQGIVALDPIVREIDASLIHAGSRRMAQWLLDQRGILPQSVRQVAFWSHAERSAFIARSRAGIRLVNGITIAIVGPPNAGKSTLANRLIGSDRIITSHEPGTTRDWISETALIKGWPVTLTDTAGIRDAACEIETEAIRRGIEQARRADLAIVLLDATADWKSRQSVICELDARLPVDLPRILVVNKSDLAPSAPSDKLEELLVSARLGTGIDALETRIESALGLDLLKFGLPAAMSESLLRTVVDNR